MLPLPRREDGPALLARLGVPEQDVQEILAGWPSPARDPELWLELEASYVALVEKGEAGTRPRVEPPWFHVYVFLAALGRGRALHAARGIPDDVSWATLADLGRSVALRRRVDGSRSVDPWWLSHHFTGRLYRLGRLQFELGSVWFEGTPYAKGTAAFSVHIPDGAPLDPAACGASFAWARELLPGYDVAVCKSWLLDPQLEEYLSPESNIVRFQRRFALTPREHDGDRDVFRFVFQRPEVDLDGVPQRTTLERAVVTHLRSGRQWHDREGWFELAK